MSLHVMTLVWKSSAFDESSRAELLAMLALADWSNEQGHSYPAVVQICEKARISIRQWKRIKKDLIDKGLLTVLGGEGIGKENRRTNRYQINLAKLSEKPKKTGGDTLTPQSRAEGDAVAVTPRHPVTPRHGDTDGVQGVTFASPGGDMARRGNRHIEPLLIEPSVEADYTPQVRRSNLIDRRKPPFRPAGLFQREDVQAAIKDLLRYQEERHGRRYTRLEFNSLMNRFERVESARDVCKICDDCIANTWKNPVFPDQGSFR